MHKCPKDANLRQQWVKFIQVKRADFVEPTISIRHGRWLLSSLEVDFFS